jgi:hypothetical protein
MLKTYKDVLFSLGDIYSAKRELPVDNNMNEYACLLIDKFWIHSSTLYHITEGLIPSVHSNKERKMMHFDIFSFNTTFRAIIETYMTFNGLFIVPENKEEQEAKFLLWQLEGLISKGKLVFDNTEINQMLKEDERKIELLETQFEMSPFCKSLEESEINKIYRKGKSHNWKFTVNGQTIKRFDLLGFSLFACKSLAIRNLYKLSSMHAHSGFWSVEQFNNIRGKVIDEKYVETYIIQAIYLTTCLIKDIARSNKRCQLEFEKLSPELRNKINLYYSKLRSD